MNIAEAQKNHITRRWMRAAPKKMLSPVASVQRAISSITNNWMVTPMRNSQRISAPNTTTRRGHMKVSPRPTPRAVSTMPGPRMCSQLIGSGSGRIGRGASRPIGTARSASSSLLGTATVSAIWPPPTGGSRVPNARGALAWRKIARCRGLCQGNAPGERPTTKAERPPVGAAVLHGLARCRSGDAGGGLLVHLEHAVQRGDAGDLPLVPHLVDHPLDVVDVLIDQVGEAALPGQELADGNPSLLAAVVGVDDLALDHLVQREDAGLDAQLAQLVRVARVVVPALRAGVEGVDEGRAAHRQRLAHLVHVIERPDLH